MVKRRRLPVKESGAEITFCAVTQDGDDGGVGAQLASGLESGEDVGAGGGADEQAELAVESARHSHGVGAIHSNAFIDRGIAQQRGDEPFRDAFDDLTAGTFTGKQGATARF